MRALTLTQPWCGLVASGIKLVENRPRAMIKREDFGKPFALHASRQIDEAVYFRIAELAPDVLPDMDKTVTREPWWFPLSRITSAVIAVATLHDAMYIGGCNTVAIARAVERAGLPRDQLRWTFGPTAYVLRDIQVLAEPVRCRGYQAFWKLAPDLEARVVEQLTRGGGR